VPTIQLPDAGLIWLQEMGMYAQVAVTLLIIGIDRDNAPIKQSSKAAEETVKGNSNPVVFSFEIEQIVRSLVRSTVRTCSHHVFY